MIATTLSMPLLSAEEYTEYAELLVYLPRDLLRQAEAVAEDGNVGDWLADLLSSALREGGAA